MTPAQQAQRLASLTRSPEGEALLELLEKHIDIATQEMMTNTNTNAMFSARGAVAALTRLRDIIHQAPALADTLRKNPPS